MSCEEYAKIVISIVSHGQVYLVAEFLESLNRIEDIEDIGVILTLNIEEPIPEHFYKFRFKLKIIKNTHPKGFAANHNAAFQHLNGEFFCVVNPDILLVSELFSVLMPQLLSADVGVVAPTIVDEKGEVQDSARLFPTPLRILARVLRLTQRRAYKNMGNWYHAEWVAGMFMLFKSEVFERLNGFDEKYFLYCEDTDICARLWKQNYQVLITSEVTVIHAAQRHSHRHPRYLLWHAQSLLRFFISYPFYELPKLNRFNQPNSIIRDECE